MLKLNVSSGGRVTGQLELPMPLDEMKRQLDTIRTQYQVKGALGIHTADCAVPSISWHLGHTILNSDSTLQKLNRLAEVIDNLNTAGLYHLSKSLNPEFQQSLDDVLRIASHIKPCSMNCYEVIPGVTTEQELGTWLVEHDRLEDKAPATLRPYLDYRSIGIDYRNAHEGEFLAGGYTGIRTGAMEQVLEKQSVLQLTLATADRWYYLRLPASEEEMTQAKQDLDVEDFFQAGITAVKFSAPQLNSLIPLDTITVEDAHELALCLKEMEQEDGEEMKFCAVLEAEQPETFAEALNIAMNRDDYELVPENAEEYGKQVLCRIGADDEIIDTIDGYTRSDGYNLLTLINRYMDICREQPSNLAARAKAEKYAKILAKTIINPEGDASNYGQNAFFYDAAEGLLTAVILLLAEYLPPTEEAPQERRHIVSVFKLVQDLLAPSKTAKGKNGFQILMDALPDTHKARWFAGAALNSAEQAMASVMSTVLSRLNAFLDSELEQVLCFDSAIDAELFASRKSAIFLVLPEEDPSKNFMAGLMIQTLSRELFSVADENGGKLPNRVVLFCDELGTMPAFDILPLFSAGRSRKLTLVPIIQSLAQLEKNYGKEGAEIIVDNVQDTIFGGFAPNSQTAEVLSKALGSRTVMSGSVSKGGGKDSASRSLQMMERPLMTPDELKSIPKGQFVVMKTGTHPMQTRLRLFLDWGISFGDPYLLPERATRKVAYASKQELEQAIFRCHHAQQIESDTPPVSPAPPKTTAARGGASYAQARRTRREPSPPVVVRTDGEQE